MTGLESKTDTTTSEGDHKTEVKVKEIYFLRVIIYYIKKGDSGFKEAAEFLEKRLKKRYPLEKKNKTMLFAVNQAADFITAWAAINTLSKNGQHILKRVHFLGHGGETALYFQGNSLSIEQVANLAPLNWSIESVLVLHSCKGGHEYFKEIEEQVEEVFCIAREFSKYQQTRVAGQMVGANFSNKRKSRTYAIFSKKTAYLWGYCSGSKTRTFVTDKESDGYNLYSEYKQLATVVAYRYPEKSEAKNYSPSDKIWPCQVYINGQKSYRDLTNNAFDLFFM